MSRSRVVEAAPERVWELVSDPYSLPRWWPRCSRVEDVAGEGRRSRWTAVMETERGKPVRADLRCVSSARNERYAWEQDVADTPFERILQSAGVQIELQPAGESKQATRVTMRSSQRLRGFSRLGAPLMRRGARRNLDLALDGIEAALT